MTNLLNEETNFLLKKASFFPIFIKMILEKMSTFPLTYGKLPPTSGYFDWVNRDPLIASHHVYTGSYLLFIEMYIARI